MNLTAWYKRRKAEKRRKNLLGSVRGTLHQDDDILSADDKEKLKALEQEIGSAGADRLDSLEKRFAALAGAGTFRYAMRNLLDVVIVAVSVAFGIRALFLQPFQIPTGSMQPTLFGKHYIDRVESEPYTGVLTAWYRRIFASRIRLEAGNSARDIRSNGASPEDVASAARYLDKDFMNGEAEPHSVICDGWSSSGDHLFVDRVSLHFKPFRRGEIFIFNTEGITDPATGRALPGFFYIKRLVGMPGDTLKIENGMLYIRPQGEESFRPATDFADVFRRIYSGKGGYHGHIPGGLLETGAEYTVPAGCYFALGDNSRNSLDSRYWGPVPRRNIIGRALNVFWPVSRRWGMIDRLEPLDVPSGEPHPGVPGGQTPAMRLQ